MINDDEEHCSALTVDDADDKMASSPRKRKKVVTFASMAELAEIQALASCEIDPQASEIGKAASVNETRLQASQDPSLFLNMPLEDYDATDGKVRTIFLLISRKYFKLP